MRSLMMPAELEPSAIPESDLDWLEHLRSRHVQACGSVRAARREASELPARQREAREAWQAELFGLAAAGAEAPPVPSRFEPAWLAGELAAGEARVDSAVADLIAVWAELEEAVGTEHCASAAVRSRRDELEERAEVRPVDAGGVPSIAGPIVQAEEARAGRFFALLSADTALLNLRRWAARRSTSPSLEAVAV